jgi:hypothetical protein
LTIYCYRLDASAYRSRSRIRFIAGAWVWTAVYDADSTVMDPIVLYYRMFHDFQMS